MSIAVLAGCVPETSNPSLAGLNDQKEHARRRKYWNQAFTSAALKEYEVLISQRTTELIRWLSSQTGDVDLSLWFERYT